MTLKQNILWAWSLSRGFRLRILLNLLLGILVVLLSLLFIYLSKSLVDRAVSGSLGDGIMLSAIMIGGVILLQQLALFLRGRIDIFTSTAMMNTLRERLFHRVMLSRWSGKERYHTGDITARLEGDARKVSEVLSTTIPTMLVSAFELLFSFLFMLSLDSRIAWILFVIMPISLLFSKRYILKIRQLTHSIRDVDSSIQSHIQEQVQFRTILSAMGSTISSIASLKLLSGTLLDRTMQRTNYTLYSRAVVRLGFSIGYFTAFLWGVNGINSGVVSFGVMTAFLQLVAKVQIPVVEMSSHLSTIAQATSAIDRLGELDALELEQQGEQNILPGALGVRFSDVNFRYDGREVLSGFECDFAPSKLHIIVGETGSGKSTILRLMLGFLTPQSGDVTIYNSVQTASCSSLTRANFVYVPQGNTLISGTIRDNIVLGDPTATEQQIREVLHIAVADFVYDLPDGLATICTERGAGLSEGEAQRIAIARGLLRRGGLLLLDEPTSALDSQTEQLLIDRLTAFAKSRTIIMVTHRQQSSLMSQSIVRLERNRV